MELPTEPDYVYEDLDAIVKRIRRVAKVKSSVKLLPIEFQPVTSPMDSPMDTLKEDLDEEGK